MNKEMILKKIEALQEMKEVGLKCRAIFSEKFFEEELKMWDFVWNHGNFILSEIVGEDYEVFYNRMNGKDKMSKLLDNADKPGWVSIDSSGLKVFIPDSMQNSIMHSEESATVILEELTGLFALIK